MVTDMPKTPLFSRIRKKLHYWLYEEPDLKKPLKSQHSYFLFFVVHVIAATLPFYVGILVLQNFGICLVATLLAWIPYSIIAILRRRNERKALTA